MNSRGKHTSQLEALLDIYQFRLQLAPWTDELISFIGSDIRILPVKRPNAINLLDLLMKNDRVWVTYR